MPPDTNGRRPRQKFGRQWRNIRAVLGFSIPKLTLLALVSVLAAAAEAGVLALVVHIGTAMSSGRDAPDAKVGPLQLGSFDLDTLLAVALVLGVMRTLLQLVAAWLPARVSADTQSRIRRDLFAAFTSSTWPVQADERDGRLQEMMSSQANNAGRAVLNIGAGFAAVWGFATLVASAIIVSPSVALLVLVAATVLSSALYPLTRVVRRMARQLAHANLNLASGVSESVRMAEEIYVFGIDESERNRIVNLIRDVDRPFFRTQLLSRGVGALYQGAVMILLVAGLAALRVIGTSHLPSLGAVVLILVRSFNYGQVAQSVYQNFNEQLPSVELIRDTLERYRRHPRPVGTEPLGELRTVAADHLSFGYRPDAYVLHDVSFEAGRGEVIGIVGPSGSGKSTLVQLLLQLRLPAEGTLLVNGTPASAFLPRDWFRLFAYVPQDCRLIAGTVIDNVRFSRPWITEAEVVEACHQARIHEEVVGWSNGYRTLIGQRADAVSGGQRQRLAIARALAGRPQVLVLDEPTSALDSRSEAAIHETLSSLRGSTLVFLVSHRLSMLATCDRIMVLDGGVVEAMADPATIMSSNHFVSRGLELATQSSIRSASTAEALNAKQPR